ncbi:unnamed protein product [Protopolystoma xenopodis]|uniref:Uncharacterized protein n=1 Tax=Protopolystoma xenopodis TaxID=117903 RepID=A0A3S5BD21_9PLAT|nr:unnamed protein product [Protopolystoma xenopodis]
MPSLVTHCPADVSVKETVGMLDELTGGRPVPRGPSPLVGDICEMSRVQIYYFVLLLFSYLYHYYLSFFSSFLNFIVISYTNLLYVILVHLMFANICMIILYLLRIHLFKSILLSSFVAACSFRENILDI